MNKYSEAERRFEYETERILPPAKKDTHEISQRDQLLEEWIAYADKLEAALKLACGQTGDRLMRMHAEQGLRLVRPDGD